MSSKKIELILCMGSSCFARGNKILRIKINDYIDNLSSRKDIDFKGFHCLGHCNKGPNIKINDKTYEGINEDNYIDILDEAFSKISQ